MVDMVTISTVLTSLKTATDIARFLKDSDLSLEKAEAKLKLADIVSALADAKMEIAQIQELLIEKDQRIKKLEEELNFKEKMIWCGFAYYQITEGEKEEGPFCPQCYDNSNKIIRLQMIGKDFFYCNTCKQTASPNYSPDSPDSSCGNFNPLDY